MLDNSRILITGGTGSLGTALLKMILKRWPTVERLVVFSRDELKQSEMARRFTSEEFPAVRFFLGDVRDRTRLRRALAGIDVVIHAAALKQVPAAEYNPMEFVRTNVTGAENVIEASIDSGVKKVIALSTDKAAAPINLYGATKLCSDKLFVSANAYSGTTVKFSVVRYGNVMGSRGSVIPLFLDQQKEKILSLTDKEMTRFNITLEEGANFVLSCLDRLYGGEIFVPKLPSYRLADVAQGIGPNCEHKEIGIRPGEKMHEEMITGGDSYSTVDLGRSYALLPPNNDRLAQEYFKKLGAAPVKAGFSYNSRDNIRFLSVDEIRELIRKNIDQNFIPL